MGCHKLSILNQSAYSWAGYAQALWAYSWLQTPKVLLGSDYFQPISRLEIANLPHHFIKPGMHVDFFNEGVVLQMVGGDELQVGDPATVIDALNVLHPHGAVVLHGIYFIVFDLVHSFYFPAHNDVIVHDDRLHRVAVDLEGHQTATLQAGEREPRVLFCSKTSSIH